jgi:hypothetical protein
MAALIKRYVQTCQDRQAAAQPLKNEISALYYQKKYADLLLKMHIILKNIL